MSQSIADGHAEKTEADANRPVVSAVAVDSVAEHPTTEASGHQHTAPVHLEQLRAVIRADYFKRRDSACHRSFQGPHAGTIPAAQLEGQRPACPRHPDLKIFALNADVAHIELNHRLAHGIIQAAKAFERSQVPVLGGPRVAALYEASGGAEHPLRGSS